MPKKVWRSGGEEQQFLEELFQKRELNAESRATDVQSAYPIFKDFSEAVFRIHFSKTKKMLANNREKIEFSFNFQTFKPILYFSSILS